MVDIVICFLNLSNYTTIWRRLLWGQEIIPKYSTLAAR